MVKSGTQEISENIQRINDFVVCEGRKTVVVQGLGFVGAAMMAVLARARNDGGCLLYNVIGVDLPDESNYWKVERVNKGESPVTCSDTRLNEAYRNAHVNGNMMATSDEYAYSQADVVVVDVNLDICKRERGKPQSYIFDYEAYKTALMCVASNIQEDTLVIIETTVPPGTTEKIVYPLFKRSFEERGLDSGRLYLAFSYERVMPGAKYLDSVVNFYRVYAGINDESKHRARGFLESFINTSKYPLSEVGSTTTAEMAKMLENSYRAVNIAFIQEWTEFAQEAGVDLFEVVEAIRMRPTHNNIMSPGFGVGGYCLPKDSLLADWSYRHFFKSERGLSMSLAAIAINDMMPDYAFCLLKSEWPVLKNSYVTILGVSYRNDVADTRNSPTELFYERCVGEGATVKLYDDYVDFWEEKGLAVETRMDALSGGRHDVVIFAVRHESCVKLSAEDILSIFKGVKVVVDANNVINDATAKELLSDGVRVIGVGKGHWKKWV
ncbi:MAG: nucleotide sugar dehydrogenase [Planctomycetota bacterium]|jgi:nucleotide sugar dehydrogenase